LNGFAVTMSSQISTTGFNSGLKVPEKLGRLTSGGRKKK
jgi:hypothetical protein